MFANGVNVAAIYFSTNIDKFAYCSKIEMMKNYVVSDIHGQDKMLSKLLRHLDVRFGDDYKLYIVGDILDRGYGGYNIYKLITSSDYADKVVLLKGNHEHFLCQFISMQQFDDNQGFLGVYLHPNNGTRYTIAGVAKALLEDGWDSVTKEYSEIVEKYGEQSIKTMCAAAICAEFEQQLKEQLALYKVEASEPNTNLLGQMVYTRLKEMAEYFSSLPNYLPVETKLDKFLLVHSGWANCDIPAGCIANWNYPEGINTMEDLPKQDPALFLRLRLFDNNNGVCVMASNRFDGHILVGGHTATTHIRGNILDKSAIFCQNQDELVSIAIDGSAYEKGDYREPCGQLNCLDLDELSQIIVKNNDKCSFDFIGCPEELGQIYNK